MRSLVGTTAIYSVPSQYSPNLFWLDCPQQHNGYSTPGNEVTYLILISGKLSTNCTVKSSPYSTNFHSPISSGKESTTFTLRSGKMSASLISWALSALPNDNRLGALYQSRNCRICSVGVYLLFHSPLQQTVTPCLGSGEVVMYCLIGFIWGFIMHEKRPEFSGFINLSIQHWRRQCGWCP